MSLILHQIHVCLLHLVFKESQLRRHAYLYGLISLWNPLAFLRNFLEILDKQQRHMRNRIPTGTIDTLMVFLKLNSVYDIVHRALKLGRVYDLYNELYKAPVVEK